MIDVTGRFHHAARFRNGGDLFASLHDEETTAAFRVRAENAIDAIREQGDQHPVVLILQTGGLHRHDLATRIAHAATKVNRDGRAFQITPPDANCRVFILSRIAALRVLESCGRRTLGRDFRSLFAMSFEAWKFLQLTLVDDGVRVNLCSPATSVA